MSPSNLAIASSPNDHSLLNSPYGGELKELYLPFDQAEPLRRSSFSLPGWNLTPRQLCDLELLLNGAFSPLTGFLGRADYEGVVKRSRLPSGTLWPIPITLDVSSEFARTLAPGAEIALRDGQGVPLALLTVDDIYVPDRDFEARSVYGTADRAHPGVATLFAAHPVHLGGRVRGLQPPQHFDFANLRLSPRMLREEFVRDDWRQIVAFQTRNPMHRAHRELTVRAAELTGARILLHPVVGLTKPGDIDHYTRVRCYQALLNQYPKASARLALLPLAMRMAGPREALWHAIIRKNYGASHFIVGRDHAGPGKDAAGEPFYEPYAAQELLAHHQRELGIQTVPFPAVVYAANRKSYLLVSELNADDDVLDISGTELRRRLHDGESIPDWFTYPQIAEILRERHPAGAVPGVVLFFTGLSGAGKSTVAQALIARLHERSSRAVTLLDGDEVRKHLSKGLGFSREDRDANVLRIAWVAAEVARHGGIAVCAPIAPYSQTRIESRRIVEAAGGTFVEIHISTALEVCESRDRKGLYAAARRGDIKQFTGISDPYEAPENPELRFDTDHVEPILLADRILTWLDDRRLVGGRTDRA